MISTKVDSSVETQKIINGFPVISDGNNHYTYEGCYFNRGVDNLYVWKDGQRQLDSMTIESCNLICKDMGNYEYMGLEYGNECWCSSTPPGNLEKKDGECMIPCSGDQDVICGGPYVMSVYKISPGIKLESF